MCEYFHTMTNTTDYLRYAVYYSCLNAWKNRMLPTIHDLKESLKDDGISDDTINRFLPESKLKKLSMNLPGVKLMPYLTLSETLVLPSDIGLVKAYVDWYNLEADRKYAERLVKDPELRRDEENIKKGSPVFDKIWQNILTAKKVSS
jgi:hypothetical protein